MVDELDQALRRVRCFATEDPTVVEIKNGNNRVSGDLARDLFRVVKMAELMDVRRAIDAALLNTVCTAQSARALQRIVIERETEIERLRTVCGVLQQRRPTEGKS